MPIGDSSFTLQQSWNGNAAEELIAALTAILRQIHDLIEGMTDEQYTRKLGGALASSIGSHIRHNLDHVAAVISGLPLGAVDYDQRVRGTTIETSRLAGMAAIRQQERDLEGINWCELPGAVRLRILPAPDRPRVDLLTTPDRELAFVLSHTIHHNAIIAVIASLVGANIPTEFGSAPATIAHQRNKPCVHSA